MPDRLYDLRPPDWFQSRADHYLDYADSFRVACRTLLDLECQEVSWYSERDILPILSLFRQYVELQLKGFLLLLEDNQNFFEYKHDLEKLLTAIKELNRNFNLSTDSENFIKFINILDKTGESFRYPEDLRGNMFFENLEDYYEEIGTLSRLYPKITKAIHELETMENVFRVIG